MVLCITDVLYWRWVDYNTLFIVFLSIVFVGLAYKFFLRLKSPSNLGWASCLLLIVIALLFYADSINFSTRARDEIDRYAKSYGLKKDAKGFREIKSDKGHAYYEFFKTSEGELVILLVRETEEGLGPVEERPIQILLDKE